MAVSSPTGTGSETVTLPGRRLTGFGVGTGFSNFLYTGVE